MNGPAPESRLRAGEALSGEIKGGAPQLYKLALEAGQCARLVIERRGIDLIVSVVSPDRGAAIRFENPAGQQSPIFASVASAAAGEYTIEVRPVEKWAAAGHYVIRFDESHARGPSDEKRLAAALRMAEGRRLQLLETEESRRAALKEYEAALALWQELSDKFEEANALHFMAQTYKARGMFDESVSLYEQVLKLREGDSQATGYTLLDVAAAHRDLRNPLDALPYYERALSIFRGANNRRGEAITLYSIGFVHAKQWDMVRALEYYEQALPLHHAEGDLYEEARTLNAMGGAYDVQLNPQKAMNYYERAIAGWEAVGDPTQRGNTLSNLGKLYDDFGEWQKALEHYDRALASLAEAEASESGARQRASINSKRASTLYNIGYTYITFGDFERAMKFLQQSFDLHGKGNPRGQGLALAQMGYAEVLRGNPQRALELCEQALKLQRSTNDWRLAQTLTVMGMAYDARSDHQKAVETYREALALQKNDLQGKARTLTKMGEAYEALGESDKALGYFGEARVLWHSFGERDGEGLALFGEGRVESARGNPDAALKQAEAALELTERLRSNITDRQLRASYFATKVGYYGLYIDLLMHTGDAAQVATAFAASERSRARSLLDLLADARVEAVAGTDGSLAGLVEKHQRLLREMRATVKRRAEAVAEKKGAEAVASIEREASRLDSERDRVEAQIRSNYPRYAALMFPQPLGSAEVQRLLDADTLLLEFFLGGEASYVWAVTPTSISGHRLPPRREIEAAARRLKELLWEGKLRPNESAAARHTRLAAATEEYWREASALSRTLLGPVAAQFKGKRLLVVADGELMYLPFGALPSPEEAAGATPAPLMRDHIVVNLPSASVLSALRQTARRAIAPQSVAVFADPVFEEDDPRVKAARRGAAPAGHAERREGLAQAIRDTGSVDAEMKLSRLPSTRQEADYIYDTAPTGSRLRAMDFDANHEKATDPRLGRYSIVHFATHGILDEAHPELSGLVLSLYDRQGRYHEEGFLRLGDIYGLSLPVDLVVLSACRTGLGKEMRGEGLIGLVRGFMYAGAARVVASLWKVEDAATAELMKRFYKAMLQDKMPPAAALRAAQVSMWEEPRWRSPYFWSGFILQGEWL